MLVTASPCCAILRPMRSRPTPLVLLAFATLALAALASSLPISPARAEDRVGGGFRDSVRTFAARPVVADTGQFRRLRWSPSPAAKCDWYVVFEAGIAHVFVRADDWVDNTLFTNSVGLMRNVGERDALGGSLDMHLVAGDIVIGPSVRWRHFVGNSASAEAMVSWANAANEGVDGLMATLRYAPASQVYVEAGAFQYRRWEFVPYPQPGFGIGHQRHDARAFAGIGFTGAPAAATWTVEALALAVTFVIVMGLSD